MKLEKVSWLIAIAIALVWVGSVVAQQLGYDGSPEGAVQAEQGTILRDLSTSKLWVKTGGLSSTGWVALNVDTMKGMLSGSVTLVSGNGTFTNTALSTNSKVFLTQVAPAVGYVSYSGPTTNGVVTVTASTNAATNQVNWFSTGN